MIARFTGILAAAVLIGIGCLHGYWAVGGQWGSDVAIPRRDGKPLFTPGPAATIVVAILLWTAALVLLGRVGIWGRGLPRWPFVAATWAVVAAFSGRVVGDFRWFGLFKQMTGTPFAWWDSWLYVPLCASLALAALVVASSEP